MARGTIILALLATMAGCRGSDERASQVPGEESPPANLGQMELWKFELMREDRRFAHEVQTAGFGVWSSYFAPDGAMIQTGVGEIRGREAIQEVMSDAVRSDSFLGLTWIPDRAEVSESGDLGYTVGRYRSTSLNTEGDTIETTGMYVTIWRRQADEGWEAEMDLGNPISSSPLSPSEGGRAQGHGDVTGGGPR